MAFGGVVQTAEATVTSGAITVNFSAATAGNLLIFAIARSTSLAAGNTWGTPSGWTAITSTPTNTGNVSCAWYYKIAAGGETSVTSTESVPPGNARGIVIEYEGAFDGSTPLDVSAEDETNLGSAVTSQPSGTTGTTAQADELAVAVFATDAASTWDTGRSYSNSFTEDIYSSASVSTGRPACIAAHRVLTTTGTYSTTLSTSDTGDEIYGAIATFKKQASGGTQYEQDASGGITPAGAAIRATSTSKGGALTPAGEAIKSTQTAKVGALTPAGALAKSAAKAFTGTLTSAGALIRQATKAIAGTLTSSGALEAVKAALLSIGGTLTSAGVVARQTSRSITGTLTQAGQVVRQTAKSLTGAITPSGALAAIRATFVELGGTLTMAGAMIRATAKQVGGAITPGGAISRGITRLIAGTLNLAGALMSQSSGEAGIGPGLRRVWHVLTRRTGATDRRETHQVKERGIYGD